MGPVDISYSALGICFLLLLVSMVTNFIFKLRLFKELVLSVGRMTLQLLLVGIFLKYLFLWNNIWLNLLWLLVMIGAAVQSTVKSSGLKISKVLFPSLLSFLISSLTVIFFVNYFVIRIQNLFDARYLVVMSGMLLGNSLRGNIVGLSTFYNGLRKDQSRFFHSLSAGATLFEAILPYLRESLLLALKPNLASMATIGIVALPGMMTGNILGGTSPEMAIRYQIMIMVAIYVCVNISVLLTLLFSLKSAFTPYGTLERELFVNTQKKASR